MNSQSTNGLSVAVDDVEGYINSQIVMVTKTAYDQALAGAETVLVSLPDGSSLNINSEKLLDAVETQIADLQSQRSFLRYVLSDPANIDASSFTSMLSAAATGINPCVYEKYTQILTRSGNSVSALQSFFALSTTDSVVHENQLIQLVDGKAYEGSVWEAAWTIVSDDLSNIFSRVLDGVNSLKQLFSNIVNALGSLIKWGITKLSHSVATVYSDTRAGLVGAMDLPLFQITCNLDFSKENLKTEILPIIQAAYSRGGAYTPYRYTWGDYNYRRHFDTAEQEAELLASSLYESVVDVIDSVTYKSITDVVVPSEPYNILLRVGITNQNKFNISGFACFTYDVTYKEDDGSIAQNVASSFIYALQMMDAVAPCSFSRRLSDDTEPHYNTGMFFQSGSLTMGLYDRIKNKCFSISFGNVTNNAMPAAGILSLQEQLLLMLWYTCIMGRGVYSLDGSPILDTYLEQHYELYTLDPDEQGFMFTLTGGIDLNVFSSKTYKPYVKSNLLPFVVHYQTTAEQANDIVNLAIGAAIAVVTIVATVKLVKWRRKRLMDTDLAKANMESLAWQYSSEPSTDNMQSYRMARKKYRKMNRVNGLLGLSSGAEVVVSALSPFIDEIADRTTANSSETVRLIRGYLS